MSSVTNMSWMFIGSTFNQDISGWDVSSVTDMSYMFSASPFNQDISSWNVSSVTSMSVMFSLTPFNQDISSWDISKVTSAYKMFFESSNFNQNLCAWSSVFSYSTENTFIFQYSGCRYQDDPVQVYGGPFCESVCQGTEGPTSSPTFSPTTMSDAMRLPLNVKSSLAALVGGMIMIMIVQ